MRKMVPLQKQCNLLMRLKMMGAFILLNLFMSPLAEANVGLPAILNFSGFNVWTTIVTGGKAFLAIILIEALVLKHLQGLRPLDALKFSLGLNLFSTFLGLGVSCLSVAYFPLNILILIAGAIVIGQMAFFLIREHGYFKNMSPWLLIITNLVFYLIFGGLYFSTYQLAEFSGGGRIPHEAVYYYTVSNTIYTAFCALGLFLIGFLASVVSEGFLLSRFMKDKKGILRTICFMNLFSYVLLLIIFLPAIIENIEWGAKIWKF